MRLKLEPGPWSVEVNPLITSRLKRLPVSSIMNPRIVVVSPEDSVGEVSEKVNREKLAGAVIRSEGFGGEITGVANPALLEAYSTRALVMAEVSWPKPEVCDSEETVYRLFEDVSHPGGLRGYLAIVVTGQAGRPVGLIWEADLLTAFSRELRYADQVINTFLRTSGEGITVVDTRGYVQAWNETAERMYGVPVGQIMGQKIHSFFRELVLDRVIASGLEVRHLYNCPNPGHHVLVSSAPLVVNGELMGAVSFDQDVTAIVQLNEEVHDAAARIHALKKEITKLSPEPSDPFVRLKGRAPAMSRAIGLAQKVASTNATVLIRGESGVGKELFAEAIHIKSQRSEKPFIAINCAAIPSALFESELFGYKGGAFTGADARGSPGKFELANGGTIFLDEIGELPLELQAKLLRVLHNGFFYRVGGTQPVKVDVRIIAATNRNLEEMISEGRFRSDLYYRLNVVTIKIPPLRERTEDIPELVYRFIQGYALQYGQAVPRIEPEAMAALVNYPWPGNVRELRNVLEGVIILDEDKVIGKDDLLRDIFSDRSRLPDAGNLVQAKEATEREVIKKALSEAGGNKSAVAKRLGISRATLYNKLKLLGLG